MAFDTAIIIIKSSDKAEYCPIAQLVLSLIHICCSVQCTDAPAALPSLPQMQLERDDDGLLYFTMFPAEGGGL